MERQKKVFSAALARTLLAQVKHVMEGGDGEDTADARAVLRFGREIISDISLMYKFSMSGCKSHSLFSHEMDTMAKARYEELRAVCVEVFKSRKNHEKFIHLVEQIKLEKCVSRWDFDSRMKTIGRVPLPIH